MTTGQIREFTFQNVVDTILKPNRVKVGGYPEELFIDLADNEVSKWSCNICYLIVKDAKHCKNKHLFCHTCIFAWSLTYGENSQKCPVCRIDQESGYETRNEIDQLIVDKRIVCEEENCGFRAPLKIYLMHCHGRQRHSNNHIDDLEKLRPDRDHRHRPMLILNSTHLGGQQRLLSLREQLFRGRFMLQQMMFLLQTDLNLRQQQDSIESARNMNDRLHHIDQILAVHEQISEIGNMFAGLAHANDTVRQQDANAVDDNEGVLPRIINSSLNQNTNNNQSVSINNNNNNNMLPPLTQPSQVTLQSTNNIIPESSQLSVTNNNIPSTSVSPLQLETNENNLQTTSLNNNNNNIASSTSNSNQTSDSTTSIQSSNIPSRTTYAPQRRFNRSNLATNNRRNNNNNNNSNDNNNNNNRQVTRGPATPGQLIRIRKKSSHK